MKNFLCACCFVFLCGFVSAEAFELDIKFYEFSGTYSGDVEVSSVAWTLTDSDINFGKAAAQWKVSNIYAVVKATWTQSSTSKVYIYQDNASNSAPYTATSGKTVSAGNYLWSGLVKAGSGGGEDGYASVKYKIYKWSEKPGSLPGDFTSDYDYGSRWFTDVNNYDFADANSKVYRTFVSENGIWVGNGEWGEYFAKEDIVMFFGAAFINVLGGQTYGTTQILFVYETE